MAIFKLHIALTVMLEADSEAAANAAFEGATLAGIAYEIDEGAWLGVTALEETEEVTPGNLQGELFAMGNDGTFFGEIG